MFNLDTSTTNTSALGTPCLYRGNHRRRPLGKSAVLGRVSGRNPPVGSDLDKVFPPR